MTAVALDPVIHELEKVLEGRRRVVLAALREAVEQRDKNAVDGICGVILGFFHDANNTFTVRPWDPLYRRFSARLNECLDAFYDAISRPEREPDEIDLDRVVPEAERLLRRLDSTVMLHAASAPRPREALESMWFNPLETDLVALEASIAEESVLTPDDRHSRHEWAVGALAAELEELADPDTVVTRTRDEIYLEGKGSNT